MALACVGREISGTDTGPHESVLPVVRSEILTVTFTNLFGQPPPEVQEDDVPAPEHPDDWLPLASETTGHKV